MTGGSAGGLLICRDGWHARREESGMKKYPGIRRMGTNRYRIRVTTTDAETGRRKEVDRVVSCGSLQEAVRVQGELREELLAAREEAERVTVRDFATRWFERRKPKLKHSTRLRYAEQLDLIIAGLGDTFMDRLTPGMVSDWLGEMAKAYSGYTCLGLLRVLRTMTRDAQAELGLSRWPCERVTRPKPVKEYTDEEPNALTADELKRLWAAMRDTEPEWFPLFALMAHTGLRFAEASALKWQDVDFEGGVVLIRRNQYRGVIGTPKTVGSRRRLPLVPELGAILKEHRAAMLREQHPGLAGDWVFPSRAGSLLSSGSLSAPMRRARKVAKIGHRVTAHGLRRTLNTLALQVAPSETIRAIMGHTTTQMTEHYNAPAIDARRAVLGRVIELVHGCGDRSGDPESAPPPAESNSASLE